jgi:hypothetical protein
VKAAADALVRERLLLQEDADRYVERALQEPRLSHSADSPKVSPLPTWTGGSTGR